MQVRDMLKRWQVEKEIPLCNDDLEMGEVHKELKAMLQGKDWKWTQEDCVSFKGPLSMHHEEATLQSLPGDIRARWRKEVEPGRWEYVVLPTALKKVSGPALPQVNDPIAQPFTLRLCFRIKTPINLEMVQAFGQPICA